MDDVELAILDAWRRGHPRLLRDPQELARRLARRGRAVLQRPPRAWCLAIRAADTRLNQATAAIVPAHAADPHSAEHPGQLLDHSVTLTAYTLRKLCKPVTIDWPGEVWDDVARKF